MLVDVYRSKNSFSKLEPKTRVKKEICWEKRSCLEKKEELREFLPYGIGILIQHLKLNYCGVAASCSRKGKEGSREGSWKRERERERERRRSWKSNLIEAQELTLIGKKKKPFRVDAMSMFLAHSVLPFNPAILPTQGSST